MLRKIGVNVDLQVVDWGTLVSRRGVKEPPSKNPGGYHIFHTFSGAAAVKDPWGHANISTACDKAWFGWPCSPRATKALEELGQLDRRNRRLQEGAHRVPQRPHGECHLRTAG